MTDNRSNKTNKKNTKSAAETAYAYLASRMRTSSEVAKHLADKGYESGEIQETINDLIGMRYIDDYQYALRYYEYNREKRRGSLRAARELAEKGIDQETIRNAREDFLFEGGIDEFEDALAVARRELENKSYDDEAKARAAIGRRLENRGFARDIIFRVLDRIRTEID